MKNRYSILLMVMAFWLSAPVVLAQDVELEHAMRAMNAGNAQEAIEAGAHVSEPDFEFLVHLARKRAENDPDGVLWRHEMHKVFEVLTDAYFPTETLYNQVHTALRVDDPQLATMRAQDALEAWYVRGDPMNKVFRAMNEDADPLAEPYMGDWPDLYAVLIDVTQRRIARHAVEPIEPYYTLQHLRDDVEDAYFMMAGNGRPPMAARAYLDAALTPYGEKIDFTMLDGSAEARQIRLSIAKYQAINEAANGAPVSWAEGYKQYLSRNEE